MAIRKLEGVARQTLVRYTAHSIRKHPQLKEVGSDGKTGAAALLVILYNLSGKLAEAIVKEALECPAPG